MIITSYGLIVFQLAIWIGVTFSKSSEAAKRENGTDMLVFAYQAMPTRHDVSEKLHLHKQGT